MCIQLPLISLNFSSRFNSKEKTPTSLSALTSFLISVRWYLKSVNHKNIVVAGERRRKTFQTLNSTISRWERRGRLEAEHMVLTTR